MSVLKKITRSNFFIKLRSWEYWPFGIIQFPFFLYWLWLSLRVRSLTFFSASNPGIVMGGMLGESKHDILTTIPASFIPKTRLIKLPVSKEQMISTLEAEGFCLPVIFKPDIGERGFMVKRICNEKDIESYLAAIRIDFLVQDLVDMPLEFGIFYRRFPSKPSGEVTSVVIKEMLSVTGDGKSTLQDLIFAKDRAKLQWENLRVAYKDQLTEIIEEGKKIELVSSGHHALGTTFLNGNHLINKRLNETFDTISKQIKGFYYGRFDLRCASLDDLYEGKIKIVELNGCGAEPTHIYDPDFPLLKALAAMYRHWRNIFEIATENHKLGIPYPSFKEGWDHYQKFKAVTR
jgi:hypothetical protein